MAGNETKFGWSSFLGEKSVHSNKMFANEIYGSDYSVYGVDFYKYGKQIHLLYGKW